jgi:hypothetical protein
MNIIIFTIVKSINIKKYYFLCYKYYFFIIIDIINKIITELEKKFLNIENNHIFDLKGKI